jgi:hypothetical protein
MIPSGKVEGGMGIIGKAYQYIQFLVVIQDEVQAYKDFGPQTAVIFALPAQAKDYGIGFSRHYTKKLADRLCPPEFPFCLMMDDSVQYWRGVTLPDDALKPFGEDAETGAEARAKLADISLADMLFHFQTGLLDVTKDVNNFGIIGYHRLNGYDSSKRVYKRTHCTSTVILNLERLKGVDYLKRAWVWEDLQFNRDAENRGIVICKCYRFAFSSPQLREGGCANMVSRPDAPLDQPAPAIQQLPVKKWSSVQVAEYIKAFAYQDPDLQSHAEEHAKKFKDEDISGRVVIELNENDLKDLGFSMGHRKLLLKAIKALNCESSSPQ